jgi:hypothetical protein
VVVTLAALALAGCGTDHASTTTGHARASVTPTASVDQTSSCSSSENFVEQSFNGNITGCFRVPNLHSSSLVVSLQAFVFQSADKSNAPTTTTTTPVAPGTVTVSVHDTTVTPGQSVTVTGYDSSPPPKINDTFGNLCWDGCQSGLQESINVHWTSRTRFRTTLIVPDAAWLETGSGAVSAHPLVSGTYSVGVQCLGATSGCALGPADAQTSVQLKAPPPTRCQSARRCATLHLSSSSAPAGSAITLSGWAPLQSIIGRPFAPDLSVAVAPKHHHRYANLSYDQVGTSGNFNVVLAPRILHVTANKNWASLGRVSTVSSEFAGPSAIEPEGGDLVAWCLPSGLVITNGANRRSVPTAGAADALRGTKLTMFSSPKSNPQCAAVLADPQHPGTVYAGFGTAQDDSAPPVYVAALYTTDDGATWHTVPIPPHATVESFGGFVSHGDDVVALFAGSNGGYDDGQVPESIGDRFPVEITANGGATWTASTFGCPSTGPCATLGPFQAGNCAMNGSSQPILVGPPNAIAPTGVKWTSPPWPSMLNACFSQQLVATSSRHLVLLDPSSQYSLLRSTSSGERWANIALPLIPGTNYSPDSIPTSNALLLAPDGSLFAAVTNASNRREELFRLYPAAASWCQVRGAFTSAIGSDSITLMRVNETELMWLQSTPDGTGTSAHVEPLASLLC